MLFASPEDHAANPPETWKVARVGRHWHLTTADGVTIADAPTKTKAESMRFEGFFAKLYADEGRWFKGEKVNNWRPYCPA